MRQVRACVTLAHFGCRVETHTHDPGLAAQGTTERKDPTAGEPGNICPRDICALIESPISSLSLNELLAERLREPAWYSRSAGTEDRAGHNEKNRFGWRQRFFRNTLLPKMRKISNELYLLMGVNFYMEMKFCEDVVFLGEGELSDLGNLVQDFCQGYFLSWEKN